MVKSYLYDGKVIEVEPKPFGVFLWLASGFEVRACGRTFLPKVDRIVLKSTTDFEVEVDGVNVPGTVQALAPMWSIRMRYSVSVGEVEIARDSQVLNHWYLTCISWAALTVLMVLAFFGAFSFVHVFKAGTMPATMATILGASSDQSLPPVGERLPHSSTGEVVDLMVPESVSRIKDDATLGLGEIIRIDKSAPPGMGFVLRIPIELARGYGVNVADVDIQVFFYDEVEAGAVVQTNADLSYRWATLPIDWSAGDPEILEVEFNRQPLADGARPEPRKFFGYTVRLYHHQRIQDDLAEPESLNTQFPVPEVLQR